MERFYHNLMEFYEAAPFRYAIFVEFVHIQQALRRFCKTILHIHI